MSRLSVLKAEVLGIAKDANNAANYLSKSSEEIKKKMALVTQEIAGTSDGTDKKMTTAYAQAMVALNQAANAMQIAANKAADWANKV